MAQKIKPNTFRLGITLPWQSRWFFKRSLRFFLEEDHLVRALIKEKILEAGIASIEIERTADAIRVNIRAGRPGLIIGRGGKGIDDLRGLLDRRIRELRRENKMTRPFTLHLNVEELKRTEIAAPVVAQQIAFDLEKRLPYRRVMRRHLELMMQNHDVKGAKIKLGGRLNGAEISRSDWLAKGKMSLQTIRANVDYGEATAFNSYGTIGVKVWIYKGEMFEKTDTSNRPHRPN